MKRAFSAVTWAFRDPGALPQASDDSAPLALNKHVIPAGFAKENVCRWPG